MGERVDRSMPNSFGELNGIFLSRREPLAALLLLLLGLACHAVVGMTWSSVAVPVLVVGSRSLLEWLGHRYILHARPLRLGRRTLVNPVARMHAEHHGHPEGLDGIFFGARAVVATTLLLFATTAPVLGLRHSLGLVNGYVAALLIYEWFHLLAHSSIAPRSSWLRHVVAHHRHHHAVDPAACYCVSAIWADRLLGTAGVESSRERGGVSAAPRAQEGECR